jgi:hypothetical protein
MLRRLNELGRERMVIKELENPPRDLDALYSLTISECEKNHSKAELAILKRLLIWLAYTNYPLTIGPAKDLISIVAPNTPFSLEEELAGGSAKYPFISYIFVR